MVKLTGSGRFVRVETFGDTFLFFSPEMDTPTEAEYCEDNSKTDETGRHDGRNRRYKQRAVDEEQRKIEELSYFQMV